MKDKTLQLHIIDDYVLSLDINLIKKYQDAIQAMSNAHVDTLPSIVSFQEIEEVSAIFEREIAEFQDYKKMLYKSIFDVLGSDLEGNVEVEEIGHDKVKTLEEFSSFVQQLADEFLATKPVLEGINSERHLAVRFNYDVKKMLPIGIWQEEIYSNLSSLSGVEKIAYISELHDKILRGEFAPRSTCQFANLKLITTQQLVSDFLRFLQKKTERSQEYKQFLPTLFSSAALYEWQQED